MGRIVSTYPTTETAYVKRQELRERGIEAQILVDSLDNRYSGLGHFTDVALVVSETRWLEARRILEGQSKHYKAS